MDNWDYKYFTRILKLNKTSYKTVIDNSIKFMRLLSSLIVDLGPKYNTMDRKVYRGVPAQLFKNIDTNEVFRIVNWSCTSSSLKVAKLFRKTKGLNSLVQFNIKKGWYNAASLNKIGASVYKYEAETLIPPYSAWCMIDKTVTDESVGKKGDENFKIEINLAKDNKRVSMDIKTSF